MERNGEPLQWRLKQVSNDKITMKINVFVIDYIWGYDVSVDMG